MFPTARPAKVCLPPLPCPAVGPHIDNPAIWEWLKTYCAHRVASVDAETRHFVHHPSSPVGIPPSSLGLQMIIIRIRIGKAGVTIDVTYATTCPILDARVSGFS